MAVLTLIHTQTQSLLAQFHKQRVRVHIIDISLQVDPSAGKVQFCRKKEQENKLLDSKLTSKNQKQQHSLICEVQLHLKVTVTRISHSYIHHLSTRFELCVVAGSF